MATPTSIDALLAEARWLEALARRVVGDPARASDLVQDVWLASVERAPRAVERPRAWLAALLRNALRRERRAALAREERERRVASSDACPSSADVVARAEGQRVLVESVLALDEPWRSTVLWHFFDGLSSEDIARREQIPASTVRNRLSRALELLRARLERSQRGRKDLAGVALLVPEWRALLGRGASITPSTAGISSAVAATGGMIMSLALKVSAAVLAVAGLGWWLWHANTPDVQIAAEHGAMSPSVTAGIEADATNSAREALSASAEPKTTLPIQTSKPPIVTKPVAADPVPAGVLEGLVLEDGVPCKRGGHVDVLHEQVDEPPLRTTDLLEDGTFRFTGLDLPEYGLRASVREGIAIFAWIQRGDPAHGRRIVLDFGSASLTGHAWDEQGVPLRHARVQASLATGQRDHVDAAWGVSTDEEGRYAFAHLGAGLCRVVLSTPAVVGEEPLQQQSTLSIQQGQAYVLDFGVPRPWPTWSGALKNRAGSIVSGGGTLFLGTPAEQSDLYCTISIDKAGRFRARVVPRTYHVWAQMTGSWSQSVELGQVVVGDADFEHDLVVQGSRIFGRATRVDGAPLQQGLKREEGISVRLEGHDYPAAFKSGNVAADGSFAIDGLEPGTYIVAAWPLELEGGRGSVRVVVRADDLELLCNLRLRAP